MRKKILTQSLWMTLAVSALYSCKKNNFQDHTLSANERNAIALKVHRLGFDSSSLIPFKDGFIVENDIYLAKKDLDRQFKDNVTLRIGNTEQYRTTNLVTGFPRNITISINPSLPSGYLTATDAAIARWNSLKLDLTFSRVTTASNIYLTAFSFNSTLTWAFSGTGTEESGFPSNGNPSSTINLNTDKFGNGTSYQAVMTSVIQHEIGHTIGMRHTDYMNTAYSCGGSSFNEGQSTVGAIQIPGTPSNADPQSLMLRCNDYVDRSFVPNDIFALSYLYNVNHTPRAQLIHEFYKSTGQDNVITTNPNYGLFWSGWSYTGASFRAFLTQETGTIPIYEYANTSQGDHAYSPNPSDPAILGNAGWQRVSTGQAFYVYSSNATGRIPIYWYYNASQTRHVYTSDPNLAANWPGFTQPQVAWYAVAP